MKWNGTAFEDVTATTLRGGWGGGYAALINRSELGNTTAFDFQVVTQLDQGDEFRSGAGVRLRDLHDRSAAHRVDRAALLADGAARRRHVQTPERRAHVRIRGEGRGGSFTCRATLAGKRVKGTGAGGCTFKLPKTAKGKQLVVTVTATPAGGKAQTFPAYKFRVH